MRTTGQVGTASGSTQTTGWVDKEDRTDENGRSDELTKETGRVDKYDGRFGNTVHNVSGNT